MHELDPATYPDGRLLGEGRQGPGRHHPRQARRAGDRADEAPQARATRSSSSSTRSASSSPATSRRCSTSRPSSRASAASAAASTGSSSPRRRSSSELVSGLDDKQDRARPPDGPLPAPGPPRALGHLRGHEPARALEERRRPDGSRRALRRAPRPPHRQHARSRRTSASPSSPRDAFIDLYPLLPYQIDLDHPGRLRPAHPGRRRARTSAAPTAPSSSSPSSSSSTRPSTSPTSRSARSPASTRSTTSSTATSARRSAAKIAAIPQRVDHPARAARGQGDLPAPVRQERPPHRREHRRLPAPGVDADSQLAPVREAPRASSRRPTSSARATTATAFPRPAEDDWERIRNGVSPKPGDAHRLHAETVSGFWQPQPSLHLPRRRSLQGRPVRSRPDRRRGRHRRSTFTSPRTDRRSRRSPPELRAAEPGRSAGTSSGPSRSTTPSTGRPSSSSARRRSSPARSATPGRRTRRPSSPRRSAACSATRTSSAGSSEAPASPAASTSAATTGAPRDRVRRRQGRGRDPRARSCPRSSTASTRRPPGRRSRRGRSTPCSTATNLAGPAAGLRTPSHLLRDEKGQDGLRHRRRPARRGARAASRSAPSYGETASGRYLADEFAKEPFGWDFEVVRLFVLCLLRAGKIEVTSKGQTIDSPRRPRPRETFANNNLFRQASFRPKKGVEFAERRAGRRGLQGHLRQRRPRSSRSAPLAAEIRSAIDKARGRASSTALGTCCSPRPPGHGAARGGASDQMQAIARGHRATRPSRRSTPRTSRSRRPSSGRASSSARADTNLRFSTSAGTRVLASRWPFLEQEPDLPDGLRREGGQRWRTSSRGRRSSASCRPSTSTRAAIDDEYAPAPRGGPGRRAWRRTRRALVELAKHVRAGTDLDDDQQARIAAPAPKRGPRATAPGATPIPQLRVRDGRLPEPPARRRSQRSVALVDGDRLVTIDVGGYFAGGIETEEQLDAALDGHPRASARGSSAPARRSWCSRQRHGQGRPATPSSAPPRRPATCSRTSSRSSSRAPSTSSWTAPSPPQGGRAPDAPAARVRASARRRHRAQARHRR